MSDPTPKLTTACACGRSTPCCSAQAQAFNDLKMLNNALLANQEFRYDEGCSKAFDEAAEKAEEYGNYLAAAAIRALVKKKPDG